MGIIILSIVSLIIGICLAAKEDNAFGWALVIIGGIALWISFLASISKTTTKDFENTYALLKEELDVYHQADSSGIHYIIDLEKKMDDANEKIRSSTKNSNSFWVGTFYASGIADFEPFDIENELKRK